MLQSDSEMEKYLEEKARSFWLAFENSADLKKTTNSSTEKVATYFDFLELQPPVFKVERVLGKSSNEATKFLGLGDDSCLRSEFDCAQNFYTACIAVAPLDSTELAAAYAKRSEALFQLKKYNACLKDIDRALMGKDPAVSSLLLRKEKCFRLLKTDFKEQDHSEKKSVEHSNCNSEQSASNSSNSKEKNYEEINSLREQDFENPIIPSISEKVKVVVLSDYGRSVIALNDIKPGEIIAIENPYASNLFFIRKYTHCANCFVQCASLIPCPNCHSVLFCTEGCRDIAYKRFHRIECQLLLLSGFYLAKSLSWAALRLFMVATKQGKELTTLMTHPLYQSPFERDCNEVPDQFNSHDYNFIHTLLDYINDLDDCTLFEYACYVTELIRLLKKTDFFDDERNQNNLVSLYYPPDYVKLVNSVVLSKILWKEKPSVHVKFREKITMQKERERYVGYLLLKLMNVVQANSFKINNDGESTPSGCNTAPGLGEGVYQFHSMFNHSCDFNVFRTFYNDTIVTHSITPIKAGEQLFITYGARYETRNLIERQNYVRQNFFFDCCCTACTENYPFPKEFKSAKSEIDKCSESKKLKSYAEEIETMYTENVDEIFQDQCTSRKLFNLVIEYLTLLHENTRKPNNEFYECRRKLIQMLIFGKKMLRP